MQFKKFEAPDIRQALAAVKLELGPDAVIVATRELRGEGLFGKPRLEVTAAVESPATHAAGRGPSVAEDKPALDSGMLDAKLDPLRRELRALRGELRTNELEPAALRQELSEMRKMIRELAHRPEAAFGAPPAASWLARLLQAADVNPDLAHSLISEVHETMQAASDAAPDAAGQREQKRVLKQVLRGRLQHDGTLMRRTTQQRIALVGPTGVGKTTTIAKLAAHASMVERKSVVLVSLDTYRVGAFEQLQHYARLMKLPLHVAQNDERFATIMRHYSSSDLILVDTAGRGPNDGVAYRDNLAAMFVANKVSAVLTLSASTRSAEVSALLRDYRQLDAVGTIFTKLDEAAMLGALVNAQHLYEVPILYVTTGQRVPEDIALAEPEAVAARIVDLAADALNDVDHPAAREEDVHHAHV